MAKIRQRWERNYGQMTERESFSLHASDATLEYLGTVIQEQATPITHIYVCLHDDHLNFWTRIELASQFPDIPIFLEFTEGSIAEK